MLHWLGADLTSSLASDSQVDFQHYTELGWEAAVGRLKVIRMISEGKISKEDTIVTLRDRTFMYDKLCKTQPYDSSYRHEGNGLHLRDYNWWIAELHYMPIMNGNHVPWRWPQDIPMILDLDFEEINPPPCIMINHRVRAWAAARNCKEENTKNLVSLALSLNLKPYISGRYAEKIDERAEYIPTLRRLASIIHHPNCIAFFTMGGPTMLAQQCCKNKLVVFNTLNALETAQIGKHPLFMSNYLNFSGCSQHVANNLAEAERILKA